MCAKSNFDPTPPVPAYHFYGDTGTANVEIKLIADGKELERWVGVTPGYCFKCKCPYFTTNQHRGVMHSTKPPPYSNAPAADSYENRTLTEATTQGQHYIAQMKYSPPASDHAKRQLRRACQNHIAAPYSQTIIFDNILIPEFHTMLNKGKRLDNRFLELARKIDAVLKALLAWLEDYDEFNFLAKQIYDESRNEHPNDKKINALKHKLKLIPGPTELQYERLLKDNGISRSDAHGGGFTGRNAWLLFNSPEICKFLGPKTFKLQTDDSITLGSDYAIFRFQQYMNNSVKEFRLSSHPGTLCEHEKKSLEILIAENGRERSILFPNHIPLRSDHYRAHLPKQLKIMGDLIPSERGTERKNQHILQIQRNSSSRMPNLAKRAETEFFRAAQ